MRDDDTEPLGEVPRHRVSLCQCGCGAAAPIAAGTDRRRGAIKGQPLRFIRGHYGRHNGPEYEMRDCGYATPCWVWQRRIASKGRPYGRISAGGRGRYKLAHRVYYERHRGPIPKGIEIDHRCGNPACVNPEHLEPVPHAVNCRRGRRAKITQTIADEIRASSDAPRVLAERFGIASSNVSNIRNGIGWT